MIKADKGQFLISTEAGGEGINLQRRCHIMVNYDLPWNPMRLVQRIGRLYRYGQHKPVVVFNIHAPQTLDARIMFHMYARLDQVASTMAVIGGGFDSGLADDIVGAMASNSKCGGDVGRIGAEIRQIGGRGRANRGWRSGRRRHWGRQCRLGHPKATDGNVGIGWGV